MPDAVLSDTTIVRVVGTIWVVSPSAENTRNEAFFAIGLLPEDTVTVGAAVPDPDSNYDWMWTRYNLIQKSVSPTPTVTDHPNVWIPIEVDVRSRRRIRDRNIRPYLVTRSRLNTLTFQYFLRTLVAR
jgi:hypothetical protein